MNRVWYKNIDWTVLAAWAALVSIGLTAIYSATHGPAAEFLLESVQRNFDRQLMWFGISAVVLAAILFHFSGNVSGELLDAPDAVYTYETYLTAVLVIVVLWRWGAETLRGSSVDAERGASLPVR